MLFKDVEKIDIGVAVLVSLLSHNHLINYAKTTRVTTAENLYNLSLCKFFFGKKKNKNFLLNFHGFYKLHVFIFILILAIPHQIFEMAALFQSVVKNINSNYFVIC